MTNEVTAYYWNNNDDIEVTTVNRNKLKRYSQFKGTAFDLVNYRISTMNWNLSNELFTVRKRVKNIIETETKLNDFYESVNETNLRKRTITNASAETIESLENAISELTALKNKLESMI